MVNQLPGTQGNNPLLAMDSHLPDTQDSEPLNQGNNPLLPGTQGNSPLLPGTQGNNPLLPGTQGNNLLLPGTQGNAPLLLGVTLVNNLPVTPLKARPFTVLDSLYFLCMVHTILFKAFIIKYYDYTKIQNPFPSPGYGAPPTGPPGCPPGVSPDVYTWFVAVDTDKSGQITATELQAALTNGNWSNFNAETCRLMIGKLSYVPLDEDGKSDENKVNFPQTFFLGVPRAVLL